MCIYYICLTRSLKNPYQEQSNMNCENVIFVYTTIKCTVYVSGDKSVFKVCFSTAIWHIYIFINIAVKPGRTSAFATEQIII